MADNATFARSLYEAWNNRDFDYGANATAPDAELIDVASGTTFRGPEGVRKYNTAWAEAFPDGQITIDKVSDAGGTVVVEYTGRGTHTGQLVSEMGTIPPTGKAVTIKFCDVNEIEDGKLRTQRSYWDTASLMAQLGVQMPAATTQQG
ncbi:MAG: ester cyclase [Nocardioidaceae bacterium]